MTTATVGTKGLGLDDDILRRMIEVRRAIHAHPELSNQEHDTSALVRRELEGAGLTNLVTTAGTGLVLDIVGEGAGAGGGRKLAIRADLDALPVTEKTGLPFESRNPGVMHACGHDGHTAMVLATALCLHRNRADFGGTVRLIFQPAEEAAPLGGPRVVAEGHLDDVDGVIGIHVDPTIESGRIGVRAGPFAAAADLFDVAILGKSGHGARPHEGVDAITVAAGVVQELQKVPAQQKDPSVPLVMTIGTIEGGTARNILADRVMLRGTIRSMNEQVRALAHKRLRALAEGLAGAHGARAEVDIQYGEPVLMNDPAMVALIERAGADVAGADSVLNIEPWTASDDFAFYAEVKPSVYFRLGVRNEDKGCVNALHHPEFTVDEDALAHGAAVLVRAARLFLDPHAAGNPG